MQLVDRAEVMLGKKWSDQKLPEKFLPSGSASVFIVLEPNSEDCLDLIFAAPPCEKVIIVPDTNYITSAIRKFMLDMPSSGSLHNIDLLI